MERGRLSLLMALDTAPGLVDTFTPPPLDTASAMEPMARGLLMLSLLMESDMESATVPGPEDISTPPPSDTASAMEPMARGLLMPSLLMAMESLVPLSLP